MSSAPEVLKPNSSIDCKFSGTPFFFVVVLCPLNVIRTLEIGDTCFVCMDDGVVKFRFASKMNPFFCTDFCLALQARVWL